jgi:hypothetical protein
LAELRGISRRFIKSKFQEGVGVANSYSSIGFSVESHDLYKALVEQVADSGVHVAVPGIGGYIYVSTPEGAEIWVSVANERLEGCVPHFFGASPGFSDQPFRVLISRILPTEGRPLVGQLEGQMLDSEANRCPIVVDLPDFELHRAELQNGDVVRLQVVAFAHALTVFDSEAAYQANQHDGSHEMGFAAESFIPSGTFRPGGEPIEPPTSEAIVSGLILASELRTNSVSGTPFYALVIKTLGGVIDMAADVALVTKPPVVGGIASGVCLLSARVLMYEPASEKISKWEKIYPWTAIAAMVAIAVAGGVFTLYKLEPLGPESCTDVRVETLVRCGRAGDCFVLSVPSTAGQKQVTTSVDKPFNTDYRGPAGLVLRRGQWLKSNHFRFVRSCNGVTS